jgi:signal transduction histidine kinase
VWHALAYLGLVAGVVDAMIVPTRTWQERGLILGLSLVWGLWYAVCIVVKYEYWEEHLPALIGYLAVGWALWLALTSFEMMYMLLLGGLYSQVFGVLPRWGKVIGGVLLSALTFWRQTQAAGFVPVYLIVVVTVTTAILIVLALFVDAIIDQSHDRQRLIEELRAAQDELASSERQAGILEERQRLAREIHDTLAQGFTSIVMHLEAIEAALQTNPGAVPKHLDLARRTARDSLAEARRLVWALQPESLERASLAQAITRFADRWSEESGVQARVTVTGTAGPLPPDIEVTLLRAAQETLSNIRRHAQAKLVTLTLSYMDDLIVLDIQDDGTGFEPPGVPAHADGQSGGYGLRSMRERVEMLNGRLSVESAPGQGTTVAIALPLGGGGLPAPVQTPSEEVQ